MDKRRYWKENCAEKNTICQVYWKENCAEKNTICQVMYLFPTGDETC
ncbi:hypothetical protein [uncultured Methanobacterium sp.]|nr:hypothetical protein [uncultured Methanobacterium sp.]